MKPSGINSLKSEESIASQHPSAKQASPLAAATLAVSSLATSASQEKRVAIRINIIIYRLVLDGGGGLTSKRLSCPRLYRVYTLS